MDATKKSTENDGDAEGVTEDLRSIGIERIMELIPHRFPMLLIDRVENMVRGESATGIKNVSMNEPFFQGHFPGNPVMPGVLIVEALAQTAGIVAMDAELKEGETSLIYFMKIQDAKFRLPVVPGDTLYLNVIKEKARGNVWRFSAEAQVVGKVVAEANFTAMFVRQEN